VAEGNENGWVKDERLVKFRLDAMATTLDEHSKILGDIREDLHTFKRTIKALLAIAGGVGATLGFLARLLSGH